MKLDTLEDLKEALAYLDEADESFAHRDLAQRCMQRAVALRADELEFEARMAFLRFSVFLHQYGEAIAMYPWFLQKLDDESAQLGFFERLSALWAYKWIISAIPAYSAISMDKALALLADFERRVIDRPEGPRLVAYQKMQFYTDLGEQEEALRHFEAFFHNPDTGMLEDCQACQPNNCLAVFQRLNQHARVLEHAGPILRGELSCHEVPHVTYPKVLYSAMQLGQWDQATAYATEAVAHLDVKKPDAVSWSYLFHYYARAGKFVQGRKVLEWQFPYTVGSQHDLQKVRLYLAVAIFLAALRQEGSERLTLQWQEADLPADFPVPDQAGAYEVAQLHTWFDTQARAAAQALDTRNGNRYWTQAIDAQAAV